MPVYRLMFRHGRKLIPSCWNHSKPLTWADAVTAYQLLSAVPSNDLTYVVVSA